jgi:hypothetical protein
MMGRQIIPVNIHELNGKINSSARGICPLFRHNVFLAKDRDTIIHDKAGVLLSIGYDGTADDYSFTGL